MKMSDVFYGDVSPKYIDNESISELSNGENSGNDWTIQDANFWLATNKEHAEYASHAINMHDELVAAIKELKAFYDDRMCSTQETMLSKEIDNLLERCK